MSGFLGRTGARWRGLPARRRAALAGVLAVLVAAAVVLPLTLGSGGSDSPSGVSGASPFTGLRGGAGRTVAVKIDNFAAARPQTGLNAADIVYAIQVEGGLSRLLAIYDTSHLPPGGTLGPVRSARESDLDILRQYGRPVFAYSGAQSRLLPVLGRASLVNCSPRQAGSAYFRDSGRPAPDNELLRTGDLLSRCPGAEGASAARDIGFRFGAAPSGGATAGPVTARLPAASFTFTWSPGRGAYLVSFDGNPAATADAGRVTAATVVVQRVAETTSPRGLRDSSGGLSPFAPTIGSGAATVLRDGRSYAARWSRPGPGDGTRFTFRGEPMTFAPGRVWIVLAPEGP